MTFSPARWCNARLIRVMATRVALITAFATWASLDAATLSAQAATGERRAVLVTGASSGIGRKITETLAANGYFVYAGARKPEDLQALNAIANVQAVKLDVTAPADITAAVETIRRARRGLYGVVNNAGVAAIAPLIEMDERELTSLFDVNVFGPYRITKAFSPLLIESKGRVVNISSISGILSGPLLGAYSMSKHAVEAYGDALAAEVARFGMKVSLIEPGNYRSEIGRNTTAQIERAVAAHPDSPYQAQMKGMVTTMASYDSYPEPDEVAKAALHALSDPAPKMRYLVVPAARQGEVTIRKAIEELAQLNQAHPFSYERDVLVKMLDEALARLK